MTQSAVIFLHVDVVTDSHTHIMFDVLPSHWVGFLSLCIPDSLLKHTRKLIWLQKRDLSTRNPIWDSSATRWRVFSVRSSGLHAWRAPIRSRSCTNHDKCWEMVEAFITRGSLHGLCSRRVSAWTGRVSFTMLVVPTVVSKHPFL